MNTLLFLLTLPSEVTSKAFSVGSVWLVPPYVLKGTFDPFSESEVKTKLTNVITSPSGLFTEIVPAEVKSDEFSLTPVKVWSSTVGAKLSTTGIVTGRYVIEFGSGDG